MEPVLFSTSSSQAIVSFLSRHPQQAFYSREIADKTHLSQGGTNQSLRELADHGLITTEKKGRMVFYSVDIKSPLIRQYKILRNITLLGDIVKKIKQFAERVVLFGSCARGEDTKESDIDLLVVSRDKERLRELVPQTKDKRVIQLLIKTPQEYVNLENKEPVFFKEVETGVVLWQRE